MIDHIITAVQKKIDLVKNSPANFLCGGSELVDAALKLCNSRLVDVVLLHGETSYLTRPTLLRSIWSCLSFASKMTLSFSSSWIWGIEGWGVIVCLLLAVRGGGDFWLAVYVFQERIPLETNPNKEKETEKSGTGVSRLQKTSSSDFWGRRSTRSNLEISNEDFSQPLSNPAITPLTLLILIL